MQCNKTLISCRLDCFFCQTLIVWAKRDHPGFPQTLSQGGYTTFHAFLHLIFYLPLVGDLNSEISF